MSSNQNRKLAAILFADIVGYTALMQRDEVGAASLLRNFQKRMQEKVTSYNGRIVNFYGDGALCTFEIPIDALRCAMALQAAFGQYPLTPVRVGIHSGTVTVEDERIFGDSVNITSRIESMGMAGAIIFSKKIRDEVKNNPDLRIQSLGTFTFKNVEESMEIFALANEGFAVPKRSEMQGKLKYQSSRANSWRSPVYIISGTAAVLLVLAALFWWTTKGTPTTISQASPSIAVLPFDDMSPNRDQGYFADGIAEEILNTLSKLKEIKVAGRTSSFSFKNKEATIGEIGKMLNVNHVLEGSIRKQDDKIRITAQLIKVDDGYHIWSKKYDRDFKDIFEIQDEVAQNIGKVLLQKLAPEQLSLLKSDHRQNTEAYELFLKAKHISWNAYLGKYKLEDFKRSERLFLQAIALDSTMAVAHAGLSELYDTHFLFIRDSAELAHYERLKVKESEIAYRLDPDNYYVNTARGWSLLSSAKDSTDYYRAFQSFLKAYQINPQNPEALLGLGYFYKEKSLIADAHKFLDRAIELDPLRQTAYNYKSAIYRFEEGKPDSSYLITKLQLEFDPEHEQALRVLAVHQSVDKNKKEEALAIYDQIRTRDTTFFTRYPFHHKLYLIISGDSKGAKQLPNQNIFFDYMNRDWENMERRLKASFRKHANPEISRYSRLAKDRIYEHFRKEGWFQEILQKEKEEYERFYQQYPRADEILVKPLKD